VQRRKRKEEEHENHERWLVSYADFITLLFAFFTTLYAISTVDAQKMGKMVVSMRASFDSAMFHPGSRTLSLSQTGGIDNVASREVLERSVQNKINSEKGIGTKRALYQPMKEVLNGEKAMERLKKEIEALVGSGFLKGMVRAHVEPRGLVISLGEAGLFDTGSDQIKPQGRILLDTVAKGLVSLGNYIRVEGHTDNVPISNFRFPSNWELSTARATAMVSYLMSSSGLRPELLSATGYAEYRPSESNDTEMGRAQNRRVDIVVLNPAAAETEPK
jgi:chemotaxis protein MotB